MWTLTQLFFQRVVVPFVLYLRDKCVAAKIGDRSLQYVVQPRNRVDAAEWMILSPVIAAADPRAWGIDTQFGRAMVEPFCCSYIVCTAAIVALGERVQLYGYALATAPLHDQVVGFIEAVFNTLQRRSLIKRAFLNQGISLDRPVIAAVLQLCPRLYRPVAICSPALDERQLAEPAWSHMA